MRVSIGIPFLNAENTLADAIRSVYAQTYPDWELILVDDGSTDCSLAIARSVADADSRVSCHSDGKNLGLAARLNQIAQLAEGEYLARLDADDMMHPERLERQITFLDAHPAVDMVGTWVYCIDASNNPYAAYTFDVGDDFLKRLFQHRAIMHPTITGRTKWFRGNPYDLKYPRTEDKELFVRTHKHTIFANIDQDLYFFRFVHASTPEMAARRLAAYCLSAQDERRLYRQYADEAGRLFVAKLIVRTYVKEAAFRFFSLLRMQTILRRTIDWFRTPSLTEEQRQYARQHLETILRTPVPGLMEAHQEQMTPAYG